MTPKDENTKKPRQYEIIEDEPAMVVSEAAPVYGAYARQNSARGTVRSMIYRLDDSGLVGELNPSELIRTIEVGLPVSEFEDLQESLGVPADRLAPLLAISKATLHRRKAGGVLSPGESDRVLRYAQLMGLAIDVFESEDAARAWLKAPQVGLGGEVPLNYAHTEVGAREVEDLLGRIEHGVYS